jgi:fido (protein-threonine AMPylation protein)
LDTELKLKFWRGDQIGAERLAATLLHIDGFSSVDPQCPLGGPDGLKDVLCEKNGWKYVAAAYFPTSDQTFRAVEDKFTHDLVGVSKNSAGGIVFLTNQSLTPSERKILSGVAAARGKLSIIYHLERIRSLLDSPSGYGARLQFLDIEMSGEEQLSFFSQWNRSFSDQLHAHGLVIIGEISKKIDALAGSTEKFGSQMQEMSAVVNQTRSFLARARSPSDKSRMEFVTDTFATEDLTIDELCLVHRALLFDAPAGVQVGALRKIKIWIGGSDATPSNATFVPPDAELVPGMLDALLLEWKKEFDKLRAASDIAKVAAITKFHHRFLSIHPFLDGNGRVARFLLTQHARELLNQQQRVVIEDRRPYFNALSEADRGSYSALQAQITQAIFGVEFLPAP